jgi:glutamyl/glutaminyl-tRNA synthetase
MAGPGEWSLAAIETALRGLAAEMGLKAADLIHPARVALTGKKVSPGIFESIYLLGREKTVQRLTDAADRWADESPHSATRIAAEAPPTRGN